MRILLCSMPATFGGLARRMISEASLLRSLGHQVFVSAPHFRGFNFWADRISETGATVVSFNPRPFVEEWRWRHLGKFLSIYDSIYLKKLRIDLAQVFSSNMTFCASRAYILHKRSIPWVISIRGLCWQEFYHPWVEMHIRDAFSSMLAGYAVSNLARENFLRYAGHFIHNPENIDVVQNGVDVSYFRPDPELRAAARQALAIAPEDFTVVFSGRLDSNKDPLLAIEIFRYLVKCFPRSRLIIAGDGVLRGDVTKAVLENGLANKVILLGHVNDIRGYLLCADAYIACSSREGFPLSTAEALASGLPAMLPNHRAYQECFSGSGALFYSVDDPEDAAMLLTVIADSSEMRADLQRAARTFAERELSLVTMNEKLCSFYEKCFRMIG